jgi:hypothetical protein
MTVPSNNRWRAVRRERFGAAGAGRQCVPATLIGRFWAAPQLHR